MSDIDQSLEQLLSDASPRPTPPPEDAAAVRIAVREEWLSVSGRHQARRRVLQYAVAASVLVGAFSIFSAFRGPAVIDVVSVATIEKSFGAIYVLSEQSTLSPANNLAELNAGQTILTDDDAGIALTWVSGGSLRLDSNTKVEFKNRNTVYLHSGQIYFDSTPSQSTTGSVDGNVATLDIETQYGVVSHLGTQFMTEVDDHRLTVSVREGTIAIDGAYDATAQRGEQVIFDGGQRPVHYRFSEYGSEWEWAARLAPPLDVNSKSTHDLLVWAGRELGMEIVYRDKSIELIARNEANLIGSDLIASIDQAPATALRMHMEMTDIEFKIDEGKIYVGNRD